MHANILVEQRDRTVVIELRRPERRNALTTSMVAELRDTLGGFSAADVSAVLIHGGDFFCSGFDLQEFAEAPLPLEAWMQVHRALAAITAPVVACVRGGAINAGAALALAADLLVVGRTCYVQVKEAEMGMVPVVNAAWLATRFSPHVGRRLALSCERVYAPELLHLGVASEVVDDEDALARALEITTHLASFPGESASTTKGLLDAALGGRADFDAALNAAHDFANHHV